MARVDLGSGIAAGLDMPGRKYNARGGYVEVSHPADLAAIKADTGLSVSEMAPLFAPNAPEVHCKCGFNQFAAFRDRPCPRCGRQEWE